MKNQTDITILLDRSGSMETIRKDMEGAFNSFLQEQKRLGGDMRLTLYTFDNVLTKIYDSLPIAEVPALVISPRGGTALLDSMAQVVDEVGYKFASKPEYDRPSRVVFVTITDGEENQSRRFSLQDVKTRIQHQTNNYNWQFVYLGANQDAFATGASMGYNYASSMTYTADSASIGAMTKSLSRSIGNYHTGLCCAVSFDKDDYAQQFTTMPSTSGLGVTIGNTSNVKSAVFIDKEDE